MSAVPARDWLGLGYDDDELASCVSCGLCLPHCPTWRVTGEEARSPRGRITAMRAADAGVAPLDEAFVASMETCVQCRGCEPACPSAVPFGHLMEQTRAQLAVRAARLPWRRRAVLRILGHHRLLLVLARLAALAQRLHLVPRRLDLPRLPLRERTLVASGDDVWLFTGCVMDAVRRDAHRATQRMIEATGAGVALTGPGAACCGALALHAGWPAEAARLARRVVESLPGEAPVLVDAAGCGAALKDYGRLLGTPEAEAFSARVLDVHEWLAGRLARLGEPRGQRPRVAVQDPCHLRHVQRTHEAVRTVLGWGAQVVDLDDEGLCCGAGGAFALDQPELAREIRDRKVEAVVRTGAVEVASANPGCALHLEVALGARGIRVRHPLEILAEALDPSGPVAVGTDAV